MCVCTGGTGTSKVPHMSDEKRQVSQAQVFPGPWELLPGRRGSTCPRGFPTLTFSQLEAFRELTQGPAQSGGGWHGGGEGAVSGLLDLPAAYPLGTARIPRFLALRTPVLGFPTLLPRMWVTGKCFPADLHLRQGPGPAKLRDEP